MASVVIGGYPDMIAYRMYLLLARYPTSPVEFLVGKFREISTSLSPLTRVYDPFQTLKWYIPQSLSIYVMFSISIFF